MNTIQFFNRTHHFYLALEYFSFYEAIHMSILLMRMFTRRKMTRKNGAIKRDLMDVFEQFFAYFVKFSAVSFEIFRIS